MGKCAGSVCVSQSLQSDARCCDAGSGVVSPAFFSDARCCDGSGVVSPACLSPSLCQMRRGQMPDAVTLAPGSSRACLPVSVRCQLLRCVSHSLPAVTLSPVVSPGLSLCAGQMPDAATLAPGSCLRCLLVSAGDVRSRCLSPCTSQSLRSDARCCDAGRCVSCLSPCVCVSAVLRLRSDARPSWSDARCCATGSGVLSPACLPVSPSLCGQMLRRWLRGRVSRFFFASYGADLAASSFFEFWG